MTARARPSKLLYFVSSDCDDSITKDGKRLGGRLKWIHRVHICIHNDEVRNYWFLTLSVTFMDETDASAIKKSRNCFHH